MSVTTKDPGKKHFYLSLLKSVMRISACGYAFYYSWDFSLQMLAGGLLLAELIGIAEEL